MPKYEHRHVTADKGESIEIPEDAIGVTTGQIGTMVTVHFLVPMESDDD